LLCIFDKNLKINQKPKSMKVWIVTRHLLNDSRLGDFLENNFARIQLMVSILTWILLAHGSSHIP
jgi:hypothetical protein